MKLQDDPKAAGFLAAIAADKYDVVTRLVFADWLSDNGYDDESAEQRHRATPEWREADEWFVGFAVLASDDGWEDTQKSVSVEQVIEAAKRYLETGEDTCLSGDGFSITNRWNEEMERDFWKYFQWWTGEYVEAGEGMPFGCCI